ncbi:hypothetical protein Tsubulata_021847, partial [Turnera subulata]
IYNIGPITFSCSYCKAIMWYEEKNCRGKSTEIFNLHYELPLLLKRILTPSDPEAMHFRENIRAYNSTFALVSVGGIIDRTINTRRGLYVFRLNRQNHHLIGSLLPLPGQQPHFITDIDFRKREKKFDNKILEDLKNMLDEHNVLVQSFRVARERYAKDDAGEFRLRTIRSREKCGTQSNTPTNSEVSMLIVGDLDKKAVHRDIIMEHKQKGLQHITELHSSFVSMQYLLLFPYGEDGYRLEIKRRGDNQTTRRKTNAMMMREYYASRIQMRENEG